MSVFTRRPVLRWALPGAALVVALGGGAAVSALSASADATLPPRTPEQLLVDIQQAQLDAGSGTVVESADLGLPTLPGLGGGAASSDLSSLVSGSHQLRVWFSGPDKARVALLGAVGESDVIRNGSDVWVWSSVQNKAQHSTFTPDARAHAAPSAAPTPLPTTPQQAAQQILQALDSTTTVSTADTVTVANRAAYDLVLRPKTADTLVGSVHIAIDGQRHVPLQVQVFARGADKPGFEIGFRSVSFARPDDGVFAFTPPKGVTVTEASPGAGAPADKPRYAVVGTGWTSVVALRPQASGGPDHGSPAQQALLNHLPTVSGPWGSGRVLSGALFSALLTDDGRVLVGAVPAQRLTQAAADPAAALR
jgi:outer membrane lipoprotein-sorting protein